MAAETGFTIDGELCPIPTLDSFTMDEAQVLYDYSGLTLEDFVDDSGESAEKARNPGFIRALMHVAYHRRNPRLQSQKVRQLIGTVNMIEVLEQLAAASAEADAGPPALSTSEPSESSERSSAGSSESSGTPSSDDMDARVVPLAPITGGSSPPSEYPQTTSVA